MASRFRRLHAKMWLLALLLTMAAMVLWNRSPNHHRDPEPAPSPEQAVQDLRNIRSHIESFRDLRFALPRSLLELNAALPAPGTPEDGLWLDPWGRPYEYRIDGTRNEGYVLRSLGPDPDDPLDDIRSNRLDSR
ncbi:MAG: type II secretion system protein GspG [Planctomycetes bacterium]|nr:type II secretion system protein GspG [Planctomycetota bacterium]